VSADLALLLERMGVAAVGAARALAACPRARKDEALRVAAAALRRDAGRVLAANGEDLAAARAARLDSALLDRLALDGPRVEAMAHGLLEIAELPDPVGRVLAEWQRPNGLRIERVSVPLGVIGIIYESRPNVTADAAALCLKAGNSVILRGGSESLRSNRAIHACLVEGLAHAQLPEAAIALVPTADREAVRYMLAGMSEYLDVLVPRGGRGLIARVQAEARVPVIGHLDGNCHVYVDRDADLHMAREIVLNAKLRRTGVCGAAESLLVDRAAADTHLAPIVRALLDAGCEVRGDEACRAVDPRVSAASEDDFHTEFLDAIISARLVDGVGGAVAHIARYGSAHTESIVTENAASAARFLAEVDSAIVLHNASTQFADGGEFGMGAEVGIATGKLHARGPVGLEQLTTYKYLVRGTGQIRPR
jgi:glutamate-5-semialdehyde dehydrogenase